MTSDIFSRLKTFGFVNEAEAVKGPVTKTSPATDLRYYELTLPQSSADARENVIIPALMSKYDATKVYMVRGETKGRYIMYFASPFAKEQLVAGLHKLYQQYGITTRIDADTLKQTNIGTHIDSINADRIQQYSAGAQNQIYHSGVMTMDMLIKQDSQRVDQLAKLRPDQVGTVTENSAKLREDLTAMKRAIGELKKSFELSTKSGKVSGEDAKKHKEGIDGIETRMGQLEQKFNEVNIRLTDKSVADVKEAEKTNDKAKILKATTVAKQIAPIAMADKQKEVRDKVKEVQDAHGITDDQIDKEAMENLSIDLVRKIYAFVYGEQKTQDEVMKMYYACSDELTRQKGKLEQESYDKLHELLSQSAKTKVAIMKASKEYPEMFAKEDEPVTKPGEKPGEAAPAPGEPSTTAHVGSWYVTEINLPLDKEVTVDVKKLKRGKASLEHEDEHSMKLVFSKLGPATHNLFGYDPKGDAAFVLSFTAGARDFLASFTEWVAKPTLGLLGEVVGGVAGTALLKSASGAKTGRAAGEGMGKFLKWSMIQDPSEINPEIAKLEVWARSKFSPERVKSEVGGTEIRYERAERMRPLDRRMGYTEPVAHVKEELGGGVNMPGMPAGSTATPGLVFQVPGSLPGIGEPSAPTRGGKTGSGDNFNPSRKKGRIRKRVAFPVSLNVHVPGINEFLQYELNK